jgi:hypothetical protein
VKITVDNWKDVEQAIRELGVQDSIYDSDGIIQTIILKSGDRYKLTKDIFQQLLKSSLIDVKLGRRVDPNIRCQGSSFINVESAWCLW